MTSKIKKFKKEYEKIRKDNGNDPLHIDPTILPLIKELNKIGIKTIFSCVGHRDGDIMEEGYITISLPSLKGVEIEGTRLTLRMNPVPPEDVKWWVENGDNNEEIFSRLRKESDERDDWGVSKALEMMEE